MKYYFTFGQIHVHPQTGEEMKNYYIEIGAENEGDAREIMFSQYSDKWAFSYTENNFNPEYFPDGCYEQLGSLHNERTCKDER